MTCGPIAILARLRSLSGGCRINYPAHSGANQREQRYPPKTVENSVDLSFKDRERLGSSRSDSMCVKSRIAVNPIYTKRSESRCEVTTWSCNDSRLDRLWMNLQCEP